MAEDDIKTIIAESATAIASMADMAASIDEVCNVIVSALQSGGKVLTAGNGGSAAEAMHMSEELVGRFRGNRVSLPGISLTADSTAITCIGNDFGFDHIFSRQIEGLGVQGDILVLFSTSGNAANLKLALDAAKGKGMTVVSILGRDGGALAGASDYELILPGAATERIQETHQVVLHIILDAVETAFSA